MESDGSRAPESETNQQPPRHQDSDTPKSNDDDEEEKAEPDENSCKGESKTTSFPGGTEILKAIEVVERDSAAIAQSFTSLFASLRLGLSQNTSTSVDHMSCFSDAAGRLQESALDAATKGNRYINSCLRLNEEMKGINNLASQLYQADFRVAFFILPASCDSIIFSESYMFSEFPETLSCPQCVVLRRNVDALDSAVNRMVRFP